MNAEVRSKISGHSAYRGREIVDHILNVKGGVIWSRISFWRSVRQQKTTTKLVTTAKPNFLLVPKT